MSLLAHALQSRRPQNQVVLTTEQVRQLMLQSQVSDAGAHVTADSAMRLAAVYACIRVLSQSIAQVPLLVYLTVAMGRERARTHWLWRLLHVRPNQWQSSFRFRQMMEAHRQLHGNAYAIKTVVRDEIRELIPIPPPWVEVTQDALWRLNYLIRFPDGRDPLPVPPSRMFHLRGMSLDGYKGLSPIAYQREVIGTGLQLTKFGAKVFSNGTRLSGVLEHPKTLSKPAKDRLVADFDATYAGADNAWKTMLLEEGMKFTASGMTNEDAQFLESRKLNRTEIAAIYGVPPHRIGDLERATFSNIEQQGLEFVTYTMMPIAKTWEEDILLQLVPEREQETVFAEFLFDGLLRGDFNNRMAGYRTAVTTGWMSRNEVRERENLNREPGLDEFLTQLNMGGEDPPPPDPSTARRRRDDT